MKKISEKSLQGERALFQSMNLEIENCVFENGESPLKESKNITITDTIFRWKYPLWYCQNIIVKNSTLLENARSGIWYTDTITVTNSIIEAPKAFRRAKNIHLVNVMMPNALETFWNCQDIQLETVNAKGDYFGLDSQNIKVNNLHLSGNYSFDGCKDVEIHDSILLSKDAFWNCENVTVYNSKIIGEYLGWNSKNITFINCTIESLQGLCYIENLKMINCKLMNTSLAFEYSSVEATIDSHIDSVKNPKSGKIVANSIGELIMDDAKINPANTSIIYQDCIYACKEEQNYSCV